MSNPATNWICGEISLGKLLSIFGSLRPSGDDLAGAIRNHYKDQIALAVSELRKQCDRAQLEFQEATKDEDKAASAALVHAYTHAESILRLSLGHDFPDALK